MVDQGEAEKSAVLPVAEIERVMIEIWEKILPVKISAESNYFELGANSLSIIKFVYELEDRGYNFGVTVNDVFSHQNVQALSRAVYKNLTEGQTPPA